MIHRSLIVAAAIVAIASCSSYQPLASPIAPMGVEVEAGRDLIWITPEATRTKGATSGALQAGLIFYPGGLVAPEAYISMLAPIAEQGYPVAIVKMPRDLAVFGLRRASIVLDENGTADRWVIAGHSLGGAMAARFLAEEGAAYPAVRGIAFLGSYPADDLSSLDYDVVSVWACEDGLATPEDREETASLLPATTQYVKIPGGNHSGFGEYGPQTNDGDRSISLREQHALTRTALLGLLSAAADG